MDHCTRTIKQQTMLVKNIQHLLCGLQYVGESIEQLKMSMKAYLSNCNYSAILATLQITSYALGV